MAVICWESVAFVVAYGWRYCCETSATRRSKLLEVDSDTHISGGGSEDQKGRNSDRGLVTNNNILGQCSW